MKGHTQAHTEESLHLTVLICKMGIAVILPLSTAWVIAKFKGDEIFVALGENAGYFSVQSCNSGFMFVGRGHF